MLRNLIITIFCLTSFIAFSNEDSINRETRVGRNAESILLWKLQEKFTPQQLKEKGIENGKIPEGIMESSDMFKLLNIDRKNLRQYLRGLSVEFANIEKRADYCMWYLESSSIAHYSGARHSKTGVWNTANGFLRNRSACIVELVNALDHSEKTYQTGAMESYCSEAESQANLSEVRGLLDSLNVMDVCSRAKTHLKKKAIESYLGRFREVYDHVFNKLSQNLGGNDDLGKFLAGMIMQGYSKDGVSNEGIGCFNANNYKDQIDNNPELERYFADAGKRKNRLYCENLAYRMRFYPKTNNGMPVDFKTTSGSKINDFLNLNFNRNVYGQSFTRNCGILNNVINRYNNANFLSGNAPKSNIQNSSFNMTQMSSANLSIEDIYLEHLSNDFNCGPLKKSDLQADWNNHCSSFGVNPDAQTWSSFGKNIESLVGEINSGIKGEKIHFPSLDPSLVSVESALNGFSKEFEKLNNACSDGFKELLASFEDNSINVSNPIFAENDPVLKALLKQDKKVCKNLVESNDFSKASCNVAKFSYIENVNKCDENAKNIDQECGFNACLDLPALVKDFQKKRNKCRADGGFWSDHKGKCFDSFKEKREGIDGFDTKEDYFLSSEQINAGKLAENKEACLKQGTSEKFWSDFYEKCFSSKADFMKLNPQISQLLEGELVTVAAAISTPGKACRNGYVSNPITGKCLQRVSEDEISSSYVVASNRVQTPVVTPPQSFNAGDELDDLDLDVDLVGDVSATASKAKPEDIVDSLEGKGNDEQIVEGSNPNPVIKDNGDGQEPADIQQQQRTGDNVDQNIVGGNVDQNIAGGNGDNQILEDRQIARDQATQKMQFDMSQFEFDHDIAGDIKDGKLDTQDSKSFQNMYDLAKMNNDETALSALRDSNPELFEKVENGERVAPMSEEVLAELSKKAAEEREQLDREKQEFATAQAQLKAAQAKQEYDANLARLNREKAQAIQQREATIADLRGQIASSKVPVSLPVQQVSTQERTGTTFVQPTEIINPDLQGANVVANVGSKAFNPTGSSEGSVERNTTGKKQAVKRTAVGSGGDETVITMSDGGAQRITEGDLAAGRAVINNNSTVLLDDIVSSEQLEIAAVEKLENIDLENDIPVQLLVCDDDESLCSACTISKNEGAARQTASNDSAQSKNKVDCNADEQMVAELKAIQNNVASKEGGFFGDCPPGAKDLGCKIQETLRGWIPTFN